MKTLNKMFLIAAVALGCSTAALAEQAVGARNAVLAPASCEELIITAQRVTATPAHGTIDRAALTASIKLETGKALRQSLEQVNKDAAAHPPKTALQSTAGGTLQARL